jgi:ribosome-associated protein
MLAINETLSVDDDELQFEFSRSSGPGGQNVNKVETKVRLRFDLEGSVSLTEAQKTLARERLASRINRDGILSLSCQRHRSREANRQECIARFVALMADALEKPTVRKPTRISRAQKERRLENKQRRSEKKAMRKKVRQD